MSTSSPNSIYLKVKDHSVSGENFQLILNEEMEMLETSPKPSEHKLPDYYKSDDYISHTDARRNLFEKAYHFVKNIALKKKLRLINAMSNSKTLLDVGCGTGDFLQVALKAGWTISGTEPNDHARAVANKKTNGAVFNSSHLQQFKAESFDVITLWHVLEHLPNVEQHMLVFKTLLKENGTLIIAVPNFKSYDAEVYQEFWAAFDAPRHLWHFSQTTLEKLTDRITMKIVATEPMKFDAYYVSLLSEKYKFGKLNYFKGFWNGWRSNANARRTGEYSSLIYVIKKT